MSSTACHPSATADRSRLPDPAPRAAGERIAPWQVRAAMALMEADLAAPLTLADLAAAAGISPFHFARGFRNAVGEPPLRYLARLRIREACRLLATTDTGIAAVSRAVGYRSPQAFARAFERHCGMAPRAYRLGCEEAVLDPSHCCHNDLPTRA